MSYQPQPGTIAYRALAWLEGQPAGTELTASMWAEAIGTDGNTLSVCVKPAVDAGAVKRFTKDGMSRPVWFSLGDGVRPTLAEEARVPVFLSKATEKRLIDSVPPGAAPAPTPAPTPVPIPEPSPPPAPQAASEPEEVEAEDEEPPEFDAWLSARTGGMVLTGIELDDDGSLTLQPEHVDYLRKLLGVPA